MGNKVAFEGVERHLSRKSSLRKFTVSFVLSYDRDMYGTNRHEQTCENLRDQNPVIFKQILEDSSNSSPR